MNTEKYLKKKAEEDLNNQRTERMETFGAELSEQSIPVKTVSRKRKIAAFSGAATFAAACCAAILCVTVINRQSGNITYNEADFITEDISLQEVNDCLELFTIESKEYKEDCTLVKDSVSGDGVFYSVLLSVNNEYKYMHLELIYVINENYTYSGLDIYELETAVFDEYTISYSKIKEETDGEYTEYDYVGTVTNGDETIYIAAYEQFSVGGDAFFDVIQSVIQTK